MAVAFPLCFFGSFWRFGSGLVRVGVGRRDEKDCQEGEENKGNKRIIVRK